MGVSNFQEMITGIQKNRMPLLCWLYGEETYFVDEILTLAKEQVVRQGLADFNYDVFYVGNTKSAEIRNAIETMPVMSSHRLVVVKEAQGLREKDLELLAPLILKPVETTHLIFVSSKIDRRKKFFKDFEKMGSLVELKRPYENQIGYWIQYISKKYNLVLATDAITLLGQLVGTNLSDMNSELNKLSQFIGDRRPVSIEDVCEVVSRVRIDSVFDLTSAIGSNDRAKALVCLAYLLEQGQNEIGALALISRHLRTLMNVYEGVEAGLRGKQLCAKAGVPQFFLKQYMDQVRFWSKKRLERAHQMTRETDIALKSSPISSHIWLENFIIQTCY